MVTELFAGTDRSASDPLLERLRLATVGTYDIAGELGRGGMAVVYVGADLKLQRTVAIKVMDPRLSLMPGMAERFLQEARIAARLQHPSVIVVHDVRQNEELIFFVMSLIEGGAVDELCRRPEPIAIDEARWILLHASSALAYAHSEGIVHRDVKPANILVNLKGDVVLTDFGIAKAVDGGGLTKSGTQIGTPVYMSPEQFSDRPVGPASDQYALGVTAYEMLTGRPPFTGELYALIAAHGTKAPVPIRQLRPDCPAYLANAVMRMLEKEPENRWPSLDDLHDVFGANLPNDGGIARRQLAATARDLHRQRSAAVQALTARPPLSPVPTNSGRVSAAKPRSSDLLVTISPPGATIFVGGTLDLAATVSGEAGDLVDGATVSWSSSDTAVLVVRADGRVTGTGAGSAVVRATVAGGIAEAMVKVDTAPIARLTVSTPSLTMRVGDVVRPAVSALDVTGSSRTDVSLSWISRTPDIAQLDAPGSIRGVHPGIASVEVSAGNVRRLIDITVVRRPISQIRLRADVLSLELGASVTLHADAFDDLGAPVQGTALRWRSSAPSIIHVDSAGTAMAIGPGSARIFVESDETGDALELHAVEAPIHSIELAVGQSELEVGDEASLFMRVKDATGGARSTAGVQLFSTDPSVATLDPVRMTVRAMALGEAHLVAQADGPAGGPPVQSVATIVVAAPAIVRVEIQPSALELDVGAIAGLSVRCVDRRGREVTPNRLQWWSDSPHVVSLDASGAARALSAGTSIIRAGVNGPRGTIVEALLPIRVKVGASASGPELADPSLAPSASSPAWSGATPSISPPPIPAPSTSQSSTPVPLAPVPVGGSMSSSQSTPPATPSAAPPVGSRTGESRKRAREQRPSVPPMSATQVVPSERSNPLADVSAASLTPVSSASPASLAAPEPSVPRPVASPEFAAEAPSASALPKQPAPRGAMIGAALLVIVAAGAWYATRGPSGSDGTTAGADVVSSASQAASPPSSAVSAPAGDAGSVAAAGAGSTASGTSTSVSPPTSDPTTSSAPAAGSSAARNAAAPKPVVQQGTTGASQPSSLPASARGGAPTTPANVASRGQGLPTSPAGAAGTSTPPNADPKAQPGTRTPASTLPPVNPNDGRVSAAGATGSQPVQAPPAAPAVVAPEAVGADDVRQAAEALVQRIRRGGERSGELAAFFKDGDKHTVDLVGTPTLQSLDGGRARSQFQIRLFRTTPGGVPQTRTSQLTMEVQRKDGGVTVTSLTVGELIRAR